MLSIADAATPLFLFLPACRDYFDADISFAIFAAIRHRRLSAGFAG
jgi:hypothetical protein